MWRALGVVKASPPRPFTADAARLAEAPPHERGFTREGLPPALGHKSNLVTQRSAVPFHRAVEPP